MAEKIDKKTFAALTSSVLKYTTDFFHEKGFTQLMPVILSSVTDPLGPDPNSSVIKAGEIESGIILRGLKDPQSLFF